MTITTLGKAQNMVHPKTDVASPAEMDTLGLLVLGYTNAEIGRVLGITENAVKCRLRALMAKWEANNRTHLVVRALVRRALEIQIDDEVRAPTATLNRRGDGAPVVVLVDGAHTVQVNLPVGSTTTTWSQTGDVGPR